MKCTPLGVCRFVMMAMIAIFFLLLIIVAIVRVLASPSHEDNLNINQNKINQMMIDLIISDPINIELDSIERNQKITVTTGMTILVVQGTESDGLYTMDVDKDLIRIDCVKNYLEYIVKNGKNKDMKYKWEEHHEVANNIWRKIINNNYDPTVSILLREDMAEVLLFIEEDVSEVTLEFSNIYCLIKFIIHSSKSVKIIAKLQKQEWNFDTNRMYQGNICNNTLFLNE